MAALCAVVSTASAQLEKGKLLIGGSIGHFTMKNKGDYEKWKFKTQIIAPTIGYFINDHLAIGTTLRISHSKNTNQYYVTQQTNYEISPFVRYYVDISTDFKFFGEFAVAAGNGKIKGVNILDGVPYPNISKTKNYGAYLAPGLAFLPAKRWSVNLQFNLLNYQRNQVKNNYNPGSQTAVWTNNFNFGFNTIGPSIGVNFHL